MKTRQPRQHKQQKEKLSSVVPVVVKNKDTMGQGGQVLDSYGKLVNTGIALFSFSSVLNHNHCIFMKNEKHVQIGRKKLITAPKNEE